MLRAAFAAVMLVAASPSGAQVVDVSAIRCKEFLELKQDRIGSIEVGKNADVVLWSGNPFSVYTRAEKVWIDGALMFDRTDPTQKWRTDFELGFVPDMRLPGGTR